MSMRGVVLTEAESKTVRDEYAKDPKAFRARAVASDPTIHRALARMPVQAATRAALLRACDAFNPPAPSNDSHQPSAA